MPASSEAAGPAYPRLIIEEVTSHLGPDGVRVRTALALGHRRFTGLALGRARQQNTWELAAAAAVAAMQQCLQQLNSDPTTPQVQLLDVTAGTTGTGQEYITATVRVTVFGEQTDLLGSALVRNDRSRTAVAAALDASQRFLGRADSLSECGSIADSTGMDRARAPQEEPGDSVRTSGDPSAGTASAEASLAAVPPGYPAIGVAVTANSVQASVVNSQGAVLADARREPGDHATREIILALAAEAAREVFDSQAPHHELTSLGLALDGCPGPSGGGMTQPLVGISAWGDWEAVESLAEDLHLPVAAISAREAVAFAEISFGAAEGITDTLYVRVGPDIELAVIARAAPLATSPGSSIDRPHLVIDREGPRCTCGESGCWQALASTEALVGRALKALRGGAASAISAAAEGRLDDVTPSLVVRMAAAGDTVARRALQETGRYFALGLANMIALFGPQAVVIDSQSPTLGAALLRAAEGALKSSPRAGLLSHCVLLTAELGDSAAALGAAAWAARTAS